MQPAARKAPFDYLFAWSIGAATLIMSFFSDPSSTAWIMFGVGVLVMVSVIAAGLRPVPRDS